MSWKRRLIRILDNKVGRLLLRRLATIKARQLLHLDVEIGFKDGWYHRIGQYFIPDGPRFDYFEPTLLGWRDEISGYLRDAADFWFSCYNPAYGDVIIDIGAGRGEDILAFSEVVGSSGKIIAIEAHPITFEYLTRFCQLNQLSNVIALHAAITRSPGNVKIADGDDWESNSIRCIGAGLSVRGTTVDEICKEQQVRSIDFLKMNIEGAERQALLGMTEVIGKVQTICVCCHDFRADRGDGEEYRTRTFVTQFLAENGFEVYRRSSDPRDYVRDHVFGTRSER